MMATDASEIMIQTNPSPVPDNSFTTMSLKMTRKNQHSPWKLRLIYLQCYFLSIATILGTGILGLPVTIAHAGLLPFLITFLIGFLVQGLVIYLFVELLQRCQVAQVESLKGASTEQIIMEQVEEGEVVPARAAHTEEEEEEEVGDEDEGESADTGLLTPDAEVDVQSQAQSLQPNLHLLGRLFLSRPMSHAFDCIILFQFISVGISYVLAGSEAYAALFNVSHIYVIPLFTWILTLSILLAQLIIQPITSLLTLFKGLLLIVTVAVTFVVGSEVGLQSSADFSQMGKPFLMGTVALGGIVNVMPMLFSQISHNKNQILWFRRAVLAGLTTCAVLNILWCWAILEIVPQTTSSQGSVAGGAAQRSNASRGGNVTPFSPPPPEYSYISLEASENAGEIATIPLTKIIREQHKAYCWVSELIQIFIAISITVSFLVMGSAMKHTIDGLVSSFWTDRLEVLSKAWERRFSTRLHVFSAKSLASGCVSLLAFGTIFVISACDPRGFVVMLDKVVSLFLNTEVGLFVFAMLQASKAHRFQHLSIPLPVSRRVFSLSWLLPVYFLFAVGYDVLLTLMEVAESLHIYKHGPLMAANGSPLTPANTSSPL
ncbi:uncharacterized protein si:ch211-51h4.2 [Gadus morhua]|uniref:uncharacterized protein si:ch211-51h4.2 n=1 Tax=Gadus morhua TaxID=8049 RepID=UPI0011B512BC|nr:uncharacterized protein LOC115555904 [Gadus morhua]